MEENPESPQGEFHHFQLVNQEGDIPLSISVLVHYNQRSHASMFGQAPITADDIIAFHEGLKKFDGDFAKAFSKK
jgi:hypothetical protein